MREDPKVSKLVNPVSAIGTRKKRKRGKKKYNRKKKKGRENKTASRLQSPLQQKKKKKKGRKGEKPNLRLNLTKKQIQSQKLPLQLLNQCHVLLE